MVLICFDTVLILCKIFLEYILEFNPRNTTGAPKAAAKASTVPTPKKKSEPEEPKGPICHEILRGDQKLFGDVQECSALFSNAQDLK